MTRDQKIEENITTPRDGLMQRISEFETLTMNRFFGVVSTFVATW
jgi:hypothetical protein